MILRVLPSVFSVILRFLMSVTCIGQPSKGWSCTLRKASSLVRQYHFLIYWLLQKPLDGFLRYPSVLSLQHTSLSVICIRTYHLWGFVRYFRNDLLKKILWEWKPLLVSMAPTVVRICTFWFNSFDIRHIVVHVGSS